MNDEPRPDLDIPETYGRVVTRQFAKNRFAVSGLAIVIVLFATAIMADFIANDKPLIMRYQGHVYFPVLKDYAFRIGIQRWQPQFLNVTFKQFVAAKFAPGDWAWFPPI